MLDRQQQAEAAKAAPGVVGSHDARISREVAFQRLTTLHLDRSYRLATVVMGRQSDAQDAVHDAFVTAWRKYDSLRDPEHIDAWFDRIVVNTCRNLMRRSRHLRVHDISERPDIPVPDTTAHVADEVVIRRALDTLKPDDRIVLALRFYLDMKVDDIAAAMGIRPRAATSRLHRALGRLRTSLEQDAREVAT